MWAANAVLFMVGLQLFAKVSRCDAFLRYLLYGGVALALEAVLQLYTANRRILWIFDTNDRHDVIMGPVPYHNHFAAIIALVLPIAFYYTLRQPGNLLSYGWMVALLAGAVFASESRSGSVLVVLELVALLAWAGRRLSLPARLRRAVAIALLVGVGGALVGWERLWERMQSLDDSRLVASRMSVEMIRTRLLRGYGLGTWPSVSPMFARSDDGLFWNQGHNDWLQWAAEGGIAFVSVTACFAMLISIPAVRSGWGIGVPGVLVLCWVDFPLQKPAVSMILFAIAGAVSAASMRIPHSVVEKSSISVRSAADHDKST
jgi:hypothetical protein